MIRINASLIALFISIATLAANAQAGEGKGKRFKKMAQELNLSPEQMEEIKAIRKSYRADLRDLKRKRKAQKEELKSLMNSKEKGKSFQEKAKAKQGELQKTNNSLHSKRFEMMLKIREKLSAEQIKEFKEFKKEKRRGRGKGKRMSGKNRD